MGYIDVMRKLLIPALTAAVLLLYCVLNGSGYTVISGKVSGGPPATMKVGLFAPSANYMYLHDFYNDGDKDIIFIDLSGDETGTLTPLANPIVTLNADDEYTITFPSDPETVRYLIAWNDVDNSDDIDLLTENAFLPVKLINGEENVIHHFSFEEALILTYNAVYSTMDRNSEEYDLDNYSPHQDSFDAIGTSGFDFNYR